MRGFRFKAVQWRNHAALENLDAVIRNLLTHEITNLLIWRRYPEVDAAPESKDYRTRLDAYTFHEGFTQRTLDTGAGQ